MGMSKIFRHQICKAGGVITKKICSCNCKRWFHKALMQGGWILLHTELFTFFLLKKCFESIKYSILTYICGCNVKLYLPATTCINLWMRDPAGCGSTGKKILYWSLTQSYSHWQRQNSSGIHDISWVEKACGKNKGLAILKRMHITCQSSRKRIINSNPILKGDRFVFKSIIESNVA